MMSGAEQESCRGGGKPANWAREASARQPSSGTNPEDLDQALGSLPCRISSMTWTHMPSATGASRSTPTLENGMMRWSRHKERSQMSHSQASARGQTP